MVAGLTTMHRRVIHTKHVGDAYDTRHGYGAAVRANKSTTGRDRVGSGRFDAKQGLNSDAGRVTVVYWAPAGRPDVVAELHASLSHVNAVALGRTMLADLLVLAPDVIVIDHDGHSFDVVRTCRDLREALNAWIIVLSGDGGNEDESFRIAALQAGADEFLPRAASNQLIVAYVRVGLRARLLSAVKRSRLSIGDVVIDLDAHAVYIAKQAVDCRPVQFQLLVALATRVNQVVDRDSLLTSVWGAKPDSMDPRRLRIAISHLRRVLGAGASRPRIETVAHVGYRLAVDETDAGTD